MKKSVSEQVMEELLADILGNQFRPGEILSERMLTEAYGCSKTTMREILAILCQANILRSIPRLGYEVLRVEQQEAWDVMEYRRALEVGFLTFGFRNMTPEDLERLKSCNDRCRSAEHTRDLWSQWDQNAEFHMELIRLSGNRYAAWNLSFALYTLKRALTQNLPARYDAALAADSMTYHTVILEALERGDLDAACDALEKDLTFFAQQ